MVKRSSLIISVRFLFIITISFWVGSIFFFSAIAARTVFKELPAEDAGRLIAAFFDSYYLKQYIFGMILTSASLFFLVNDGYSTRSPWFKRLIIIFSMLVITIIAGTFIRSSAESAKSVMKNSVQTSQEYLEANNRFRDSHRNSVLANSIVFFLGIVILLHVSYKNKI